MSHTNDAQRLREIVTALRERGSFIQRDERKALASELDAIASRLAQQPVVGRDILREATNALEDLGAHDIARDLRAFTQQGGTYECAGCMAVSYGLAPERQLAASPTPTADRVSVPREALADRVVQSVCEMDDRSSPEDQPDMMLVTGKELRDFIIEAFDALAEIEVLARSELDEAMHTLLDDYHRYTSGELAVPWIVVRESVRVALDAWASLPDKYAPAPSPAGEPRAVVLPDATRVVYLPAYSEPVALRDDLKTWFRNGWVEYQNALFGANGDALRAVYRQLAEGESPPTTGDAREGQQS